MKVAIFCTNPPNAYSGGRYCALMTAEALVSSDHEVYFYTNTIPIFFKDFEIFPKHKKLNVHITKDFKTDLPKVNVDFVILVPGTSDTSFYRNCQIYALESEARLVLLNFETPNWFNSLSPFKRKASAWKYWYESSKIASLILSISREGDKFAKSYYDKSPEHCKFNYFYPAINTFAADNIPDQKRENRIILLTRFVMADHKGSLGLPEIFCNAIKGYTIVIIVGPGTIPRKLFRNIREKAKEYDVKIEYKYQLDDKQKFKEIKRSKLLLFPSLFEGYGYPPIEALYCNTPCVAFDLPVLRETCNDKILYAQHGDWNDFRKKIQEALNNSAIAKFKNNDVPKYGLNELSNRLNEVLCPLLKDKENPKLLKHKYFYKISKNSRKKIKFNNKRIKEICKNKFIVPTFKLLKAAISKCDPNCASVCYFPRFNSIEELNQHHYRASWYLPHIHKVCEKVLFYRTFTKNKNFKIGSVPLNFGRQENEPDHLIHSYGFFKFVFSLLTSNCILLWNSSKLTLIQKILRYAGYKIINIDTYDVSAREYGNYCQLIWENFLTELQRLDILQSNAYTFRYVITPFITKQNYKKACVFGTGPSLENAEYFDFNDCLTIVCNSIIQSDELLDHIEPNFITAGDVVSHFGVSNYAFQFREDLVKQLKNRDLYFVTTARFGYLLTLQHPEITKKTILIDQTVEGPNFNLFQEFGLPYLDSTLNIHMLPLASTFCDEIWLLGVDGKSSERSNEDFWAHAKGVQYDSLVDTGHECHPTFDFNRQCFTLSRFIQSIEDTVQTGERELGRSYISIFPSNVPVLQKRSYFHQSCDVLKKTGKVRIADLNANKLLNPIKIDNYNIEKIDKQSINISIDAGLPPIIGISECYISEERILKIRGFALAPKTITKLVVFGNDRILGSPLHQFQKRSDVAANFPEYQNERSGFLFVKMVEDLLHDPYEIRIELYCDNELIGTKETSATIK